MGDDNFLRVLDRPERPQELKYLVGILYLLSITNIIGEYHMKIYSVAFELIANRQTDAAEDLYYNSDNIRSN